MKICIEDDVKFSRSSFLHKLWWINICGPQTASDDTLIKFLVVCQTGSSSEEREGFFPQNDSADLLLRHAGGVKVQSVMLINHWVEIKRHHLSSCVFYDSVSVWWCEFTTWTHLDKTFSSIWKWSRRIKRQTLGLRLTDQQQRCKHCKIGKGFKTHTGLVLMFVNKF